MLNVDDLPVAKFSLLGFSSDHGNVRAEACASNAADNKKVVGFIEDRFTCGSVFESDDGSDHGVYV